MRRGFHGRLRRAPVQRRSAERLARILDACADLLDEVGYEELSTRAVAARAGVPIGSVYRFFGNKRALADALAERNLDRYTTRITERLPVPPDGDWRGLLDAALDEYLAMKRTAPGFSLIDFGHQLPAGAPAGGANGHVADSLVDLVAAHVGRAVDEELRRVVLIAVEAADALLRLAFRMESTGDEVIIGETRELLRAYLARVLD
ncbi:TetR/AcrR family transcriptional regulator [Streptomyces albipurpureus]|uniref:TetR family transcriptional regulator n=1 Tax=Streptomyces albipurpureus TaxID=2897419 RepID=A0ABT0UPL7_9ACTN|nr:TetR/AcrR family transcriptional regulator [Streptomyces sp. CWNU-1]MCM2390301.1 TetR family transcriptional regulator [Streptomyces sp. CWNU-1]